MDEFIKFVKDWWAVIGAFVGMFTLVWKLVSWLIKSAEKSTEKTVNKAIDKVLEKIQENGNAVATLQHDRLLQGYRYFTERGWIPHDEKQGLVDMFTQYHNSGHNHIFDSYCEDLIKLPEKPQGGTTHD